MVLKKYLPFILLGFGVLVLIVVFLLTRSKSDTTTGVNGEEKVAEIAFDKRPFVSLTPTADGHYLKLRIEKMDLGASVLDYELLYDVPDGVTQGVPGSVDIKGLSSFEAELLLGSESSGKFRYDEGVEQGTVTLRFRDEKGKLMAKFTSDFHMVNGVDSIDSSDGKFIFKLNKPLNQTVVVMNTVGSKSKVSMDAFFGPYGVFSQDGVDLSGNISIQNASEIYYDAGSYKEISQSSTYKTPIVFVGK